MVEAGAVSKACYDVPVQSVVAGVQGGAREPRRSRISDLTVGDSRLLDPVNEARRVELRAGSAGLLSRR